MRPRHAAAAILGHNSALKFPQPVFPMKESLLDVLLYLFENYGDVETQPVADREILRDDLTGAGFADAEVEDAFAWLARLDEPHAASPAPGTLRIYAPSELARLDVECRGVLLDLERMGVLDAAGRELVIDLLLAADLPIDVQVVKWACLLVMLNRDLGAAAPEAEEFFDFPGALRMLVDGHPQLQ